MYVGRAETDLKLAYIPYSCNFLKTKKFAIFVDFTAMSNKLVLKNLNKWNGSLVDLRD